MTMIKDRYASAVNSSNLSVDPLTTYSDTDVLGAYGLADARLSSGKDHFSKHPLAVPLERLFAGDSSSAGVIVQILAGLTRSKAKALRIRLTPMQATDMARATLGWFRQPACRVCGGHGFKIIPGTTTKGDAGCEPCNATGKVILEDLFRVEHRELVRWIMSKLERESAMAGPAALKAIAPKLEL